MFTQLNEPIFGMRRHTLAHILVVMDLKYGTLTTSDLTRNEAILSQAFVDDGSTNQMSTFISQQRVAHNIAEANRQPFPEATKVRLLKAAIIPCGLFNGIITLFESQHPTVAQQTFAAFAAVLEAFDNNRVSTLTAGGLKYAAAITTVVPPPQTADIVASVIAAITPLIAAAASGSRTTPAVVQQRPQQRTTRPAAQQQLVYCYSHGQCEHTSASCGNKFRPGHRDDATLARPLGGETGVWSEIKRALRQQRK
jgi:hypothetical protein